MTKKTLILFALLSSPAVLAAPASGITAPEGFEVSVLVDDVPDARSMALSDNGTLYVATRRAGKVYAVRDALSDGGEVATDVITIASGMSMPNGVAWRGGDLYVAEPKRLLRFDDIDANLAEPPDPVVVDPGLPFKNKLHSWRYIAFGPDDHLYVSIGAPCNICDEPDLGQILRMRPDGSERKVFARGVRNSVGFDWHPETDDFWFTDNGRDMLGDELPPCELNLADQAGLHFGYPFCHGSGVADPKFGELGTCAESVPPAQDLGPHVAPLGMRFYTGELFPDDYRGQVFIAEHGSWNRSKSAGRTGYRVTLVRLHDGKPVSYEPFLEGFLQDGEVIGRPVDILVAPDGALLVSDDHRGVIYRVGYAGG